MIAYIIAIAGFLILNKNITKCYKLIEYKLILLEEKIKKDKKFSDDS